MKTSKNTHQNSQNVMKGASLAMLIFLSACGKTSVPQSQTPSPAVKPTASTDNTPTGSSGNPVVLRDGGSSSSSSSSGGSSSSSGATSTASAAPSANAGNAGAGATVTTGKGQNTIVDASATHPEFNGSFAWNLPTAVVGDAKVLQSIDNSTALVIEKGQAQTQEQAQQDVTKDKSGLFCQTEGFAALTTGDTLQMLAMNSRSSALGEDWSDVTVDYQTPAGHKVKLDCKVMGQPSDDLVAATFLKALNFAGRNDQLLLDLVGANPAAKATKSADPAAPADPAKTGEATQPEVSAAAKLASAQFQKMQILKPQVLLKMEADIKKLDPKNEASVAQTPTLALGQIVTMKKAGEMLASAGGPKAVCTLEGIKGHLRTNAVYQAQKPIVDDVSEDSKMAELVFPFVTPTKEAIAFRCLLISGGSLEDVMGALKGTVKFVGSLPKP